MKIVKLIFIILCLSLFIWMLMYFTEFDVFYSNKINTEEFLEEDNYTKEELILFADIAFPYNRIQKWEEDIKVEIANIDKLKEADILEVDSVIKLLSPLLGSTKIYRVMENGNLLIYRKVDSIPISESNYTKGFCYIPPLINRLSYKISYAEVYDKGYFDDPNVFLHEFEHAIGLRHPSVQYPFYMNIVGTDVPYVFESREEMEKYNVRFYLSEEEKKVIKMLYSPHIKSGLSKKYFMTKIGINHD